MERKAKLFLLGACLAGGLAHADTIVLATSAGSGVGGLSANDSALWTTLGPDTTLIPNTFSVTSSGGKTINGSFASTGTGLSAQVGGSWGPASGPMSTSDFLVWSYTNLTNNGTGPVTLTFPSVFGVGAAIQPNSPGQFTASIALYNGITLLGTAQTELSDLSGDAIFIGALDTTGANVTKAIFSLTVATNVNNESNFLGDFAIDTLSINEQITTPEPGGFLLAGLGLIGLQWKLRRRAKRA